MTEKNRYIIFANLFKEYFAFLQKKYSFSEFSVELHENYIFLKCESTNVYLYSLYGTPDFSIDFYFGRIGIDDKKGRNNFSSGDLLYLCDNSKWSSHTGLMSHDIKSLQSVIPKLAELLKKCGNDCLWGKSDAYNQIKFKRKVELNKLQNKTNLEIMRTKVKVAWKNKDFKQVLGLLTPFRDQLKPSEILKMKIAKKKIEKT